MPLCELTLRRVQVNLMKSFLGENGWIKGGGNEQLQFQFCKTTKCHLCGAAFALMISIYFINDIPEHKQEHIINNGETHHCNDSFLLC